jgi:hypothetical protein
MNSLLVSQVLVCGPKVDQPEVVANLTSKKPSIDFEILQSYPATTKDKVSYFQNLKSIAYPVSEPVVKKVQLSALKDRDILEMAHILQSGDLENPFDFEHSSTINHFSALSYNGKKVYLSFLTTV